MHGGFAIDDRPGFGQVYYGAPGCGIIRVSPDLSEQDIIELPTTLRDVSTSSRRRGIRDSTSFWRRCDTELTVLYGNRWCPTFSELA